MIGVVILDMTVRYFSLTYERRTEQTKQTNIWERRLRARQSDWYGPKWGMHLMCL